MRRTLEQPCPEAGGSRFIEIAREVAIEEIVDAVIARCLDGVIGRAHDVDPIRSRMHARRRACRRDTSLRAATVLVRRLAAMVS